MRWARRSAWRACSARRGRTSGSSTRAGRRRGTTSSTPTGTLFEHFGTQVAPADLADREVAVILDLSAWSQLGDMAGVRPRASPGRGWSSTTTSARTTWGRSSSRTRRPRRPGPWSSGRSGRSAGTFTPEVATGLLTAIAMDTGWFRHPNTRPETLRTAAELVEAGADDRRGSTGSSSSGTRSAGSG